jgi:hypothetical protein
MESRPFEHQSGQVAFQALVQELLALRMTSMDLTKRMRTLSREESYRGSVNVLLAVGGSVFGCR